MQDIYLLDIGCLTSVGNSLEECWNNIGGEITVESKYDFAVNMPVKLKRSSDRFSKMYMYVLGQILERQKDRLETLQPEQIGTIFSSEYGPITTNLDFAREVQEKDPDICSPAKFSNTVANACVGVACMTHGYKGVSTMLQGSNSVNYAIDLLEEGKADVVFAGYAEEYNEEIFKALHQVDGMEAKRFTETAEMFLLSNSANAKEDALCRITAMSEANLGCNAMVLPTVNERSCKLVKSCVESCLAENNQVDAVIITSAKDAFGHMEKEVIETIAKNVPVAEAVTDLVGDTLGSSLNMNLVLGSMCIKEGKLHPELFNGTDRPCNRILVTGYDIMGNYTTFLLERN